MNSDLAQSVDEMKDIIDIEAIFLSSVPAIIRSIIIGLAILFLAYLLIYILKKIAKRMAARKEAMLSPEERALKYLDGIKRKKLIAKQQWRSYYFLMDEILRRYLFEKFDFDVLDKTREEILANMGMFSNFVLNTELKEMGQFWERAQMSKYAKEASTQALAEEDYRFVRGFVKRTKEINQRS